MQSVCICWAELKWGETLMLHFGFCDFPAKKPRLGFSPSRIWTLECLLDGGNKLDGAPWTCCILRRHECAPTSGLGKFLHPQRCAIAGRTAGRGARPAAGIARGRNTRLRAA